MERPLLRVSSLGKSYPVATDARARLAALYRLLVGQSVKMAPVLDAVAFEIFPGQSLGIIGENGAGKSTLLKLLAGVLTPTRGEIERHGSIGALLELGAGFDIERTGRENIGLSAGLMGWSAATIRERQPEIEAFADIGRYLDEPVKHYSSGMIVRLGFAIVATVRPQLLITDEVLAVGDESFQKKCVRWMEDYLDGGGTLLLVSHSMYHIQKLCSHALWLKEGAVRAYGDVFTVTQDYLAYHEQKTRREAAAEVELDAGYQGDQYRVVAVALDNNTDAAPRFLEQDASLQIDVELHTPDGRAPQCGFGIVRADGTAVYGIIAEVDGVTGTRRGQNRCHYGIRFDALPLLPGTYTLRLHAMDPEGVRLYDTVERSLIVRGSSREIGLVRLAHRWTHLEG